MEIWSWENKKGILPRGSCVRTTEGLHHTDPNETLKKKTRWELYKDAVCCFEQIQETAPYKKAAV